jgi:hypothetical protein
MKTASPLCTFRFPAASVDLSLNIYIVFGESPETVIECEVDNAETKVLMQPDVGHGLINSTCPFAASFVIQFIVAELFVMFVFVIPVMFGAVVSVGFVVVVAGTTVIFVELETGVAFAPLQESVYVELIVGLTETEPDVPFTPDHAPLAVQDVAFALDHVIVEEPPDVIVVGEDEMVTVASGEVDVVSGIFIF